jgi:putative ABC transport system permease protein
LIIGAERRAEWRLEWEAEIEHAVTQLSQERHNRFSAKIRLIRRCSCSLYDAVLVRRLARSHKDDALTDAPPNRSAFLLDGAQDVRLAFRTLRRTPGFTFAALLTIALGVGATTAVFSVVKAVLLAPLPHEDADRLVVIWETDLRHSPPATQVNVAPANFADWRSHAQSFEGMAVYSIGRGTVTGNDVAEMVARAWVTSDFLPLLRGRAGLGRVFAQGDDLPGRNLVAMLSHGFWQSRFGGRTDIIGRSLTLNGSDFEIIGVLEPEVDFLARGIQVWTPYVLTQSELQDRRRHYLSVMARLRPGVSRDQAQTEMETVADRIRLDHPEWMTQRGVNVVPLRDQMIGQTRLTLHVLFGAVLAVLLIAAVNVANLIVVRSTGRRSEFAVRNALGAGRSRLIRQTMAESLTISVVGGALGVAIAAAAIDSIVVLAPTTIQRAGDVSIDLHVLGFSIAVSVLTGVVFGLVPAMQSSRVEKSRSLSGVGRWASGTGGNRTRQALVVGELALSMMLLIGAGLLTQTFRHLVSVDRGFVSERILTASLRLPQRAYPDGGRANEFYDEMLTQVRAIPQVLSAGLTRFLPLSDGPWTFSVKVEGVPTPPEEERLTYAYQPVSTDYFRTAGITLLRGRDFGSSDDADAVPVVIINEAMSQRFWAGSDPIGARICFDRDSDDTRWREIVGVVADVRHDGPSRDARPTVYGPRHQAFDYLLDRMRLVVRTSSDPLSVARELRRTVSNIDPNLVVFDIRTMKQLVAGSVAQSRFAMLLVLGFAGIAAVLALVGIYGVVSYTVSQRLPELGLRIALGARPKSIGGSVLSQGMALTLLGILIGIVGAFAFSRILQSLLFEISATDPRTYVILALGLAIAAAGACVLPARRAASADPTEVMRGD